MRKNDTFKVLVEGTQKILNNPEIHSLLNHKAFMEHIPSRTDQTKPVETLKLLIESSYYDLRGYFP